VNAQATAVTAISETRSWEHEDVLTSGEANIPCCAQSRRNRKTPVALQFVSELKLPADDRPVRLYSFS
jgi:hypothetical protein